MVATLFILMSLNLTEWHYISNVPNVINVNCAN